MKKNKKIDKLSEPLPKFVIWFYARGWSIISATKSWQNPRWFPENGNFFCLKIRLSQLCFTPFNQTVTDFGAGINIEGRWCEIKIAIENRCQKLCRFGIKCIGILWPTIWPFPGWWWVLLTRPHSIPERQFRTRSASCPRGALGYFARLWRNCARANHSFARRNESRENWDTSLGYLGLWWIHILTEIPKL